MKISPKFVSGLIGALALTAFHEILRKKQHNAPRMDKLGKQSLTKILSSLDLQPPRDTSTMHNVTLVADVLGNALYYSMIPRAPEKKYGQGVFF